MFLWTENKNFICYRGGGGFVTPPEFPGIPGISRDFPGIRVGNPDGVPREFPRTHFFPGIPGKSREFPQLNSREFERIDFFRVNSREFPGIPFCWVSGIAGKSFSVREVKVFPGNSRELNPISGNSRELILIFSFTTLKRFKDVFVIK